MFETGEEPEVTTGLGIMNELVVPCIPLLLAHDTERDLLAVEDMRNRWCSYLGQEMECESHIGQEHMLHVKLLSIMSSRQCLRCLDQTLLTLGPQTDIWFELIGPKRI